MTSTVERINCTIAAQIVLIQRGCWFMARKYYYVGKQDPVIEASESQCCRRRRPPPAHQPKTASHFLNMQFRHILCKWIIKPRNCWGSKKLSSGQVVSSIPISRGSGSKEESTIPHSLGDPLEFHNRQTINGQVRVQF